MCWCCFFFQAEDGIRDLVRSRGLGDVYKRQVVAVAVHVLQAAVIHESRAFADAGILVHDHAVEHLSLIHI